VRHSNNDLMMGTGGSLLGTMTRRTFVGGLLPAAASAQYLPKQSDRPSSAEGDEPGFQPIFAFGLVAHGCAVQARLSLANSYSSGTVQVRNAVPSKSTRSMPGISGLLRDATRNVSCTESTSSRSSPSRSSGTAA